MATNELDRETMQAELRELQQRWDELETRHCELNEVLDAEPDDTKKSVYGEFVRVDEERNRVERRMAALKDRLDSLHED